jgi:hypothetical protein
MASQPSRSRSDSVIESSSSPAVPTSSSSSSASRGTRADRLQAQQFIEDHRTSSREAVVRALLAAPDFFLRCDGKQATVIMGYGGVRGITPTLDNRRQWLESLREVVQESGEDDPGPSPSTPPAAAAGLPSQSAIRPTSARRRSSDRHRASTERREAIFDICLRAHDRGETIPSAMLEVLSADQRATLREAGVEGLMDETRRAQKAKRPGRAHTAAVTVPLDLRLRPSSRASHDDSSSETKSDLSSSSSDSTTDRSSSSDDEPGRHRHRHGRHHSSGKRRASNLSSSRVCPSHVLEFFQANGSMVKSNITKEVEDLLAGQRPTVYWRNFCAAHAHWDNRSFNEGLVIAMALEITDDAPVLLELLSRRLYGLHQCLLSGRSDWRMATALLPLNSAGGVRASLQKELNRAIKHAGVGDSTIPSSHRFNRGGGGRSKGTRDSNREDARDRNSGATSTGRSSGYTSSSSSRRRSGAAPAQSDQSSSAAGGSGAGRT